MIDCAIYEEKSEKEILSGEYVVSSPNRVGFSRIMEEMTDRDFVRRIKSGDAEAWRKIFSRYFLACVRFVSGITGDDAAADATISSVAKTIGWPEDIWDLSGDVPALKTID